MSDAEETIAAPRIVGEPVHDVFGMISANDKHDVGSAFERAAEQDKAFRDEAIS
jgi:hypothetical protein